MTPPMLPLLPVAENDRTFRRMRRRIVADAGRAAAGFAG